MSDAAQTLNIRQTAIETLVEVFSTMLSLEAKPNDDVAVPDWGERVTGCVGLAGETVTGTIYVHLSDTLAKQAAAAMLGMTVEELGSDSDVNDVVGELCNMVAGNLKSALCNAGARCAISPPCVIRGKSFMIETSAEMRKEIICFECCDQKLVVEIQTKFV